MKEYLELVVTFFKIGIMTFGGGYAMLPMIQREVVEKRGWATEEEILNYYAIGQCTPGVIAVNTATFIGDSRKGVLGGFLATLGVVLPSLILISVIAAVLNNFACAGWHSCGCGGAGGLFCVEADEIRREGRVWLDCVCADLPGVCDIWSVPGGNRGGSCGGRSHCRLCRRA